MSYILEALKKSQQERGRGQVPDLQTLHQTVAVNGQANTGWPQWVGWALVVALLALAFLLGWLRPWETQPDTRDKTQAEMPAPAPALINQPAVVPPVTPPVAQPPQTLPVTVAPAVVNVPPPHKDMAPDAVPGIEQLPSLLQQSIPSMQFAGHVYSDNPAQRSVIINNRYMNEGDALMPGMTLQQITPDSVIFEYGGQHFRVTVLRDWSFK